jgi:hypothetical protein
MNKEAGAVLGYCGIAVLTFGYNFRKRSGDGKKRAIKSLAWAMAWPLYWPITHTISGIFEIFIGSLTGLVNSVFYHFEELMKYRGDIIVFIYGAIALVFVPGWQLWLREDACSNLSGCMAEVAKSFLWGIVWPVALLVFDR